MNTGNQQLKGLIAKGEGLDIEFKACRDQLPKSIYETVCAFLNRHGGTLLLGVENDGAIQGILPDAVEQIRKDFITAINNPQKLTPPTYLSISDAELNGKTLIHIYVPESSQVHRCNGRIYDRNEDGDLDITDHTVQVAQLYQRKQATYSENKVYPYIQPGDMRADLIARCRNYVRINRKNHPWVDMDDAALLQSAQLVQADAGSGESGVTLAGVMLFGHDNQILQVCPAHRTDLLLRKVDLDRYDDRDLVRTNLIDSYDRILAFIQKHLPDPFFMEGIERRSLRDHIFREVASNMLIHREYASGATSRLIIEYGRVVTDNPSRPHGFGLLNPETVVPFQKNPILSAFFREIDRADELGSGMRKMMLYGKKYGGADPQLIEGDNFRMIISVPEFGENPAVVPIVKPRKRVNGQATTEVTTEVTTEATTEVTTEVAKLLGVMTKASFRKEIQERLGLKNAEHLRKAYLSPALAAGLIEMTIPDKPTSSLQKYRLTEKGRQLLKGAL
jgi:ATP-dependent DNA helicase RecG